MFRVAFPVQVMPGQRLSPSRRHRLAQMLPVEQPASARCGRQGGGNQALDRVPRHQAFFDSYCPRVAQ